MHKAKYTKKHSEGRVETTPAGWSGPGRLIRRSDAPVRKALKRKIRGR
jgi:hypothetical protein